MAAKGEGPKMLLPALFAAWYGASVICTGLSKVLVQRLFPSAYWLSLAQFLVATSVANSVVRWVQGGTRPQPIEVGPGFRKVRRDVWTLSITFSFGMLALNKGYEHMHVSLVETLRATEPVVSAALASLLLPQEAPSAAQVLSLTPIVLGACCSSLGSADFTLFGLLWVAVSNICFCLRTIQYKRVRKEHGFDDWNLFYHICRMGSLCQLIYALIGDPEGLWALLEKVSASSLETRFVDLALVALNGAMYYSYLQLSWVILMRVAVVTHAVGNSMRRPVVLVCNVLYFRNEISVVNAAGILLAFSGVVLYSRLKA
mmetsp:Transcript_71921/g.214648  ORF Transcript_71921/g.214648 Transcript_71921/m.214648 type:complete len:315 (+) Transcript_71921:52-996(+)